MYRFIIIKRRSAFLIVSLLCVCILTIGTISTISIASEKDVQGVKMPILMYHSILKNSASAGKYVVSPDTFENDIKYLKENGYTSVFGDEVINYVKNNTPLPDKPVMITFDDGYLNNLTYIVPILEKYDMKAVISIVGAYSERFSENIDPNPNYAHLSWKEISECVDSGHIEIANHTYNMHSQNERNGCMKKRGETGKQYAAALEADIIKAQSLLKENCNIEPQIFTYPYGAVSDASCDIIKKLGFKMSLGCLEKINIITHDEDCLWQMCRFNRPSGISTADFMKKCGI